MIRICRIEMLIYVVTLSLLLAITAGCSKKQDTPKVNEQISFCQAGHTTLLTQTALERGFFTEQGFDVQIRKLGDGKVALDTMLAGDCMFGIVAEVVLIKQSFIRQDFSIIAAIASSGNSNKILASKDKGILTTKDLKGKRLGVRKGVNSHAFAENYLKKNGLKLTDVKMVFMEMNDMPEALKKGEIDAFSASDMIFFKGKQLLGDQGTVLSEPGLQVNTNYLVAKKDFLAKKPETVQRIFKALLKSEGEIAAKPSEALALLTSTWNIPPADAEQLFKEQRNFLSLPSQYAGVFEAMATWLINSGLVDGKTAFSFQSIMDDSFVKAVKTGIAVSEKKP